MASILPTHILTTITTTINKTQNHTRYRHIDTQTRTRTTQWNKVRICMLLLAATKSSFSSAFLIPTVTTAPRIGRTISHPGTHRKFSAIQKTLVAMMSQTQSHNDATSSSSTHEDKNSQPQSQPPKNAKLISTSTQSMSEAGARIRSGHLVSFPTETVYGLGCHAMDPIAVSRVFEAKERPLTDPLIVHVNESHAALALWQASASVSASEDGHGHGHGHGLERKALEALAETFWPGPLTIVAKANPAVPPIIMANTGYVACRSPSHPIARALIGASGVPIAAPSANKFGHVSPTRAAHVMYDLGLEDVWIVDPDLDSDCNDNGSHDDHEQKNAVCDVGVESTVAKVEMTSETCGIVSILRHGAVSSTQISSCLEAIGLKDHFDVKEKMQSTGENVSHVAPGQTIRHYSPDVLSFMISHKRYNAEIEAAQNGPGLELNNEELEWLKNAVIIDFGNRLGSLKDGALAYRDLSAEGNSSAAAANVFDALRWSENVEGAQRVYFPEIIIDESCVEKEEALVLAVKDRLTRAASGVVIDTLQ